MACLLCVNRSLVKINNSFKKKARFLQIEKKQFLNNRITNKKKIINDPVYGFIHIPDELLFDVVEHPYFQRLRRIRQLGLTDLVYPGALHTRFHHSLGAMHLMQEALGVLKDKGHDISEEEEISSLFAILLHDVGHGPFSHTLEHSIVENVSHETISKLVMQRLNEQHDGQFDTAISIFNKEYSKKYLSQLISSQLDVDRLDYLSRDSFFTGVSEGVVGTARIIKMLDVVDSGLVAEAKAIYSLEKFLVARRIMYWQVYLHKTVLAAENMLILILKRANHLVKQGKVLPASKSLSFFLKKSYTEDDFRSNKKVLENFMLLDDYDIIMAIKEWMTIDDPILRYLSQSLMNRRLYRCELQAEPFDYFYIERIQQKVKKYFGLSDEDMSYFVVANSTSTFTYNTSYDNINIITKDGKVKDFTEVSDQMNISALSKSVVKFFLCFPKEIR